MPTVMASGRVKSWLNTLSEKDFRRFMAHVDTVLAAGPDPGDSAADRTFAIVPELRFRSFWDRRGTEWLVSYYWTGDGRLLLLTCFEGSDELVNQGIHQAARAYRRAKSDGDSLASVV